MTTVKIFIFSREKPDHQPTPAQVRQIKNLIKKYWPGIRMQTFNRLPSQAEMYSDMIEINVMPAYNHNFKPELWGAITSFHTPTAPAETREQFNFFTFKIPTRNAKPIFRGETADSVHRNLNRPAMFN